MINIMKRLIFLVYAALFAMVATAQDLYVYSVIGKVEIQKDGSWSQLQKRMKLSADDVIKVDENSALSILDRKAEKVYSIGKSDAKKVSAVIDNVKGNQKSATSQFMAHASKSLFNGGSDKISHEAAGCTYRGDIIENDIAKTILAEQKGDKLAAINNANTDYAVTFEVIERATGKIAAPNVKLGDQAFFRIKNNSDKMLYVNVIDIDANGNLFDCLPIDEAHTLSHLMIPANSTVDLKEFPIEFAEPKGTDCMVLIAMEEPYDLRLVNKMLQTKGVEPSAKCAVGLYRKVFVVQ